MQLRPTEYRWTSEEAKAVYDRWVAMGMDVMAEAYRRATWSATVTDRIVVPLSRRDRDVIIDDAHRLARTYFSEAAKIYIQFTVLGPIVIYNEDQVPPVEL